MDLDEKRRKRLERLYRGALGEDKSRTRLVLHSHLERIVEAVRAGGARPILISYPFPSLDTEEVMEDVAGETGCCWLNVRVEFDRLLETGRREDYFVPDGHLNDNGYRVLAGLVAERILGLEDERAVGRE